MEPSFQFPEKNREKPKAEFSPDILELLRKKAQEMLLKGSEIEAINIGDAEDALYISSNPDNIIGWKTEKVDGKIFYIGQRKE